MIYTKYALHKKWSFQLTISSEMWVNPHFPEELVLFTEEILYEKLHFLCSDAGSKSENPGLNTNWILTL